MSSSASPTDSIDSTVEGPATPVDVGLSHSFQAAADPRTDARTDGRLLFWPLLEVGAFITGLVWFDAHPVLGASLFATTSLALCLALHVTFHEWVHQGIPVPGPLQPLARLLVSLCIGMPFDGYRWHHWNHHQHENSPEDFSTTWRSTADGLEPQGPVSYALTWPRQLVRSSVALRRDSKAGRVSASLQRWIRSQKQGLALAFVFLALLFPRVFGAYVATVYLGWALIALHNHGQHPPREGAGPTTYRSSLYNTLLCANGLHGEHHREPRTPWNQLVPAEDTPTVTWPHLLDPLMALLRNSP